jgi:hypothetical protein
MAKGAKSMMQPINLIFRFLNHKSRVCIWLVEQNQVRVDTVVYICPLPAGAQSLFAPHILHRFLTSASRIIIAACSML